MADLWYYQQQGETHGPLPLVHLRALAAAGAIEPATLVWQQELSSWVELSSLDTQASSGQLPPPIPPPLPQAATPHAVRKPLPGRAGGPSRTPLYAALLVVAILAASLLGYLGRGLIDAPQRPVAAIKSPPEKETKPAPQRTDRSPETPIAVSNPDRQQPAVEPDPAADVDTASLPAVTPPADPASAQPAAPATVPDPLPIAPPVMAPSKPADAKPASTQPVVLFQELNIQRIPKLGMLGTVTAQDLSYQILSQLTVAPPDQEGTIACDQVVLQTRLVKSDDLSRAMFQDSLAKLQGWQFSYQLNASRAITQWKAAPPDGRKVAAVEPPGAKGFLATSVMDDDGWKELAQLTFFVPRTEGGSKSWKQPMMHDFGPLGMWYGETTFTPQATSQSVQQITFVHKMEYRPPEKDAGDLPFKIEKAMLKPEVAGGTIEFDPQANRVVSAQEAFLVRGALTVGLLGQTAEVEVEEQQVISLKVHERNPWDK